MKQLLTALVIAAMMIACNRPVKGSNGETYKSPVQYNDYIISRQSKVVNNIIEFSRVSGTNRDSAYLLLTKYEAETSKMIDELKGMPVYKGDSTFRDAGVSLFQFYKKIFGGPYKQLLDIHKDGSAQTEEGQATMQQIIDNISKEEETHDKEFYNAQLKFSKENNMQMKKNELQEKIDKVQ